MKAQRVLSSAGLIKMSCNQRYIGHSVPSMHEAHPDLLFKALPL